MRIILTLRCVQGFSWQKTAYATGEHNEQYPRRKHNPFLEKTHLAVKLVYFMLNQPLICVVIISINYILAGGDREIKLE